MTSALIVTSPSAAATPLNAELSALGIHVLGAVQRDQLVREAARLAPDVVVCFEASPSEALFDVTSLLAATSPLPVLVFAQDGDASKIERSVACGIHAYVVNGYARARVRPLIHLALARFHHEQRLRSELQDIGIRFEERKQVDRAKGILMRARQIDEDQAFKVLRNASMHTNQRVGEIARQVIAAANEADAVNRSGQLRMLSQRIVKLHALRALDIEAEQAGALMADSLARGDANLAALSRILSKPTFGDLVDAVVEPWCQLKAAIEAPYDRARLPVIDHLAERLLQQAEQLTSNLQITGLAASLEVINVSGRQRMLSQRLAKLVLLGLLVPQPAAKSIDEEVGKTRAAFASALEYLCGVPLSTAETRRSLASAAQAWDAMNLAAPRIHSATAQVQLAQASEALLALFDQLTDQYERSMQVLLG